jgi:hypothetical protein
MTEWLLRAAGSHASRQTRSAGAHWMLNTTQNR